MPLIFSIYDSKAETWSQPMFAHNIAVSLRNFAEAAKSPDCLLSSHPGDFTLFHIGDFNLQTGKLTVLDAAVNLGTALEALPSYPQLVTQEKNNG